MYAQLLRRVVGARIGKQVSLLLTGAAVSATAQTSGPDTISISVRSDSGKSIAEAVAYYTVGFGAEQRRISARTDRTGMARLTPVPSEAFTLTVIQIGFQRFREIVRHDPGKPLTVVLKHSSIQPTEICTTQLLWGISLLLDSAITTGKAMVTARVRDGSYVEEQTIELPAPGINLAFAPERADTYDIEVSAPGYERWTRTRVRVERNRCHVIPQSIRVRLVPAK
jgi:hypothetical protein